MEHSYERLEVYRVATLAACMNPASCTGAIELFHKAATLEKRIEEFVKVYWQAQSVEWALNGDPHCSLPFLTQKTAFPDFKYEIVNPDSALLDLKNTSFNLKHPPDLKLKIESSPVISTAQVRREEDHAWSIRWIE